MDISRFHVVNFGQLNGGLLTVGYTVYDHLGAVLTARNTAGVVEFGAGSGIYGADIAYDRFRRVVVIWDTGGTTPKYANESSQVQLSQIQDETDHIRIIWNTLRSQGQVFDTLIERVRAIKSGKDHSKDFELINDDLKKLIEREQVKLADIKGALTVTVEAPKVPKPIVNLPAPIVRIEKDKATADEIKEIKRLLGQVRGQVEALKEKLKDNTAFDHTKTIDSIGNVSKDIRVVNQNIGSIAASLKNLMVPSSELVDVLKNMEREQKDRKFKKMKEGFGI